MARADGIVGARYDEKLDVVEIVTCKCVQIAAKLPLASVYKLQRNCHLQANRRKRILEKTEILHSDCECGEASLGKGETYGR